MTMPRRYNHRNEFCRACGCWVPKGTGHWSPRGTTCRACAQSNPHRARRDGLSEDA